MAPPVQRARHPAESHALGVVDFDRVPLRVLDGQVFNEKLAAGHQKSFLARVLLLERKDSLVDALPAQRDVVDGQREALREVVGAGAELERVARLGLDQSGLGLLLDLGSGIDLDDLPWGFGGNLVGLRAILGTAGRQERGENRQNNGATLKRHGIIL